MGATEWTHNTLFRIWFAFIWRWVALWIAFKIVCAAMAALLVRFGLRGDLSPLFGTLDLIVMTVGSYVVLRWTLRTDYREFRIVLAPKD